MAKRISQIAIEVLRSGDPNVRISQIAVEVMYSTGALSIVAADSFLVSLNGAGKERPYPGINDGLEYILLGDAVALGLQIEDLQYNFNEHPQIGIGLILEDNANNLSDVIASGLGLGDGREAFDSMFYGIGEDVIVAMYNDITVSLTDSLNNWNDVINLVLFIPNELADTLNLQDLPNIIYGTNFNGNDTFAIVDSTNFFQSSLFTNNDTMSISDGIAISMFSEFTVSISDNLNNWSDAASSLIPTPLSTYLRRYLNDVVN